MRNYASTMDEVTPVITRPATQSYPVDYDTGDEWLGIRLRPEHGVALWWGDLDNATDSVFGRSEVLDRLPSLAVLHETDRTSDALAHIIPTRTWPDVDPRLTSAIDILHASGGRLGIDALTKFMAFTTRYLNRHFRCFRGYTPSEIPIDLSLPHIPSK